MRSLTIASATVLALLAALTSTNPLVAAVDTPWVLGDEQSVACYTLKSKEDIPKPVGLEMHWTTPPAIPLDSTAKTPVQYWARVTDNFWNHSSNIALLGADWGKYYTLCNNVTGGCDENGECCIWHSNIHSCRAESGACEPWVKQANASDDSGKGYTLVTHTASQEGGLEKFDHEVQLEEGDWVIIAHVKIMTFQCAVGATRLSATPPNINNEFPPWGIALIAVVGAGLIGLILYVALSNWMKGAAARRAPKEGPCTIIIVSVYKVDPLWETYPDKMPDAVKKYYETVRSCVKNHDCYEVKRIGETNFVIAAADLEKAVSFTTSVQEAIATASWTQFVSVDMEKSMNQKGGAYGQDGRSGLELSTRSMSRRSRVQKRRASKAEAASEGKASESGRMTASRMLSESGAAGGGNWGAPTKLGITVGMQYGDIRVSHDEEANTYDYNGAIVSDAAILADLAMSGQIYAGESVFDTLPSTSGSNHSLSTLCQWKLETGKQNIYKITSPGMPAVDYQPKEESDDPKKGGGDGDEPAASSGGGGGGGGVLAALDQATAGLAAKKVVVVCIRAAGSVKPVTAGSKAQLVTETLALDKAVAEVVAEAKGHIQASLSGDFVVTFNAATNVAMPMKRALTMMFDLQDLFEETFPKYKLQCGITSGQALVGTLSSRTQVYSPIYRQASALAGLCGSYASMASAHSPAPFCLFQAGLKEEVGTFCHQMFVDVVRLPSAAPPRNSKVQGFGGPVNGIISLIEPKPAGGGGDDDEWMYELEAAAKNDPYILINGVWEAVLDGDMEQVSKALKKREEAAVKKADAPADAPVSALNPEAPQDELSYRILTERVLPVCSKEFTSKAPAATEAPPEEGVEAYIHASMSSRYQIGW